MRLCVYFIMCFLLLLLFLFVFFFFNDTATTEIYTLSLHDALPIFQVMIEPALTVFLGAILGWVMLSVLGPIYDVITKVMTDRKSTRLNSSHSSISYAVFCLKKKKKKQTIKKYFI